ncbi:unnamed protein product [Heligmosomoides polygyrus]|uniref:C2H2-type domain-containing protein n=1 Tax=Heligmosomoides polygyrus TaxID=6339 RepID=A0A183GRS8_HELPZ|nr:unnamed protein product [Heligmosomoides polygyrus]
MPMKPPEGVLIKPTGNENMLDFLTSRFRQKNRNAPEGFRVPPPGRPMTLVPVGTVSVSQPAPTCSGPQPLAISTCDVVNRSRVANVEPRTEQQPTSAASSATTEPVAGGPANFMPTLRRSLSNQTGPRVSQAVCIFCRCTGTPMVCEPTVRAYDAVNMLCTKFREVHPVAAQTLYNSLTSFIRDTSQKHNGRVLFCVCRWHYSPQCFDPTGRQLQNVPPSIVDGQILLKNYQQGLLYADPSCVCVLSGPPPTFSPSTSRQPASTLPDAPKKPTLGRCVVCNILPPTGPCKATTFCVDYMIAVPANPPTLKEQWAMSICRSLMIPMAHEILNAFRTTPQPKLCIRHFNPRMMGLNSSGVLVRIMSGASAAYELPVVDFAQVATLSVEFNQAFSKLLEGMEKGQNTNTIIYMLKIVQDLVKCSDERCNQPLNTITDVRLHRFHQLQHHFVCMDCFSTNCVIHTEQEMIEHFATQHFQRSGEK